MQISSDHYDVIIIGGGAIGLSVAYHLGHRLSSGKKSKILLLERNQLTSGTSWHAAGIVGPLRATPNMTKLATYAIHLFPQLEDETGQATGYRRTGGYWFARELERHNEIHRIAAVGRHFGLHPSILDNKSLGQALPCLSTDGITLAMELPEDGSVNPVDLCMAYAKGAKQKGVEICEGALVSNLVKNGDTVTGVAMENGDVIQSGAVVLATGAWSKPLADSVGLALPIQAVEHMYVVTEPNPAFENFPVIRDLDRNIYIKGDAGKLLIGVFEPNATCWDAFGPQGNIPFLQMAENWDWFTPYMQDALKLIPALADTGIQFYMNGPESFTCDTKPLIGEAPDIDGLFVAAGMNSMGIMTSAGVGKTLSEWIVDGEPEQDAWEVDLSRVDPLTGNDDHMKARMMEAVSANFDLHWPYKQPTAGRDLRHSALHDSWVQDEAHFGVTASWERPLWFSKNKSEKRLPYAVKDQPWWPIVEREAREMEHGAVMIELTPFTKIDLTGCDSLAALDRLATANLNRPLNRAIYSTLLNSKGGIEADVTISRREDNIIRITSGAATRWRDRGWLRRNLKGDVKIKDITENFSVIGVMGAMSRKILKSLDSNWQDKGFASITSITIMGKVCTATRLSFVGELGWEIEVLNDDAPKIYAALRDQGALPMGLYALDGCRIEKGFLHWGHDLNPDITPLEAGLNFSIDWNKEFQGKGRLITQKQEGVSKRLVLLDVSGKPLLLHDEPVYENDRCVGFTTSGGYGPRTGKHLALALIKTTKIPWQDRRFIIEVAGKQHKAKAQVKAVFDPEQKRMRG
jgi:4-methylaminobutanoate oxidase (formaldehyde-forming)